MNGGMSQVIDCVQITLEHVRVLVILRRDILLERAVKGNMVGTAEGQLQKISACHSACAGREVEAKQTDIERHTKSWFKELRDRICRQRGWRRIRDANVDSQVVFQLIRTCTLLLAEVLMIARHSRNESHKANKLAGG